MTTIYHNQTKNNKMKSATKIIILLLSVLFSHAVYAQAKTTNNDTAKMHATGFNSTGSAEVKGHVGKKKATGKVLNKNASKNTAMYYRYRTSNPYLYC